MLRLAEARYALDQRVPVRGVDEPGSMFCARRRGARQREANTTFFTDEYRCPAHAADIAAGVARLAAMADLTGVLHLAGPEAVSRADFARAVAGWLGLNQARLRTGTIADSGLQRPALIVLDSSLAATHGLRARSVTEALR